MLFPLYYGFGDKYYIKPDIFFKKIFNKIITQNQGLSYISQFRLYCRLYDFGTSAEKEKAAVRRRRKFPIGWVSVVKQVVVNVLGGSVADIVHPSDPLHLVVRFECFRDLYDNSIIAHKTGIKQNVNLVLSTIWAVKRKEKVTADLQLHSD